MLHGAIVGHDWFSGEVREKPRLISHETLAWLVQLNVYCIQNREKNPVEFYKYFCKGKF